MLKSPSTSLTVRGILALAVEAIALAWPGSRCWRLVILFAVYAFIAAVFGLPHLGDAAMPQVGGTSRTPGARALRCVAPRVPSLAAPEDAGRRSGDAYRLRIG